MGRAVGKKGERGLTVELLVLAFAAELLTWPYLWAELTWEGKKSSKDPWDP